MSFVSSDMTKPYAEACDQNRDPILAAIAPLFHDCQRVLEIGSGTGQHAVYFAHHMPHLRWYTSDRYEYHAGIHAWLDEADLSNVEPPLLLDVSQPSWPTVQVNAVFSANTTHIMHLDEVDALFAGVGRLLSTAGLLALYGPFNYGGNYSSDSNARFDEWLKGRDPESGIRDFEYLNERAGDAGLEAVEDMPMPMNNRLLCWRKR